MSALTNHATRWLAWGAVAAAGAALPACNIVKPVAYVIEGPPTTPAVATIPNRPTLVFVDDRQNVLGRVTLRQIIADKASEVLMVNEVATTTISPRDAMGIVRQETSTKPMAIDEIGRAVGAEQIIYVEMAEFMLSPDGYTPRPQALCKVRVIDVPNRTRMFPAADADDDEYLLTVQSQPISGEEYKSTSSRRKLEETLAMQVGEELGKMFFEHVPRELGSRLQPR